MTWPAQIVATTGSGSSRPCQGLFRDSEADSLRSITAPRAGIDQDHIGRLAHSQRSALIGKPGNMCWHDRHPFRQLRPVQQTGVDHRFHNHRERRLQTQHPECRLSERVLLVVTGMWRVVGRHRIDGPVGQRLPYCLDVLIRP